MPINSMHANYPDKMRTALWDPVHIEYPVRKFPGTDESSNTIGHKWKGEPEVFKCLKDPLDEIKGYFRDYNITKELMRSRSAVDLSFKHPETNRFNKHTSCNENLYIYPPSRRLTDQPPLPGVHGTTEMKSAYKIPTTSARLVTNKDQFKHPACLPLYPPPIEPSFHKEIEPLDTTHDGFEKYLDPYLTTSRLHHRPYTADQLQKLSNSKNVVTYYTFSDTPMVRTPKVVPEDWRLPLKQPQSTYDREKFKQGFREIITHNKPKWVPRSFRTEVRDNFTAPTSKPDSNVQNLEEKDQTFYQRSIVNLSTNTELELSTIKQAYTTENSTIGSRRRVCSIIDQYPERNKKLEIREEKVIRNACCV